MKDLMSYVPKKNKSKVLEIYKDSDGIWLHLSRPWINLDTDCPTIHEYTIKDTMQELNNCKKLSEEEYTSQFN